MRIIKVDIHGSIKVMVESNDMYVSCFDFGDGMSKNTIIINSEDKRLYSISLHSTQISMLDSLYCIKEKLTLYDISVLKDISMLAYGLQQLSEEEINAWIPGAAKMPTRSFWGGL